MHFAGLPGAIVAGMNLELRDEAMQFSGHIRKRLGSFL